MIRTFAFTLALALTTLAIPSPARAVQPLTIGDGLIAGVAQSQSGQIMAGTTVRIRNLGNQQVVNYTTSHADGRFSISGLPAGMYLVEVLDANGRVVGTSSLTSLDSSRMQVRDARVTAQQQNQNQAAAASGGSFFTSTAGIVTLVAIAGGVAAVTIAATRGTASPSR
jgi:hypothetical protein